MEDLTRNWKKLSLTEKEGDKLDLSKNKKTQVFVLAAKFFTRRSLNLEAVAKTFKPLWRTRKSFEVSEAGDNRLLFAFQTAEDVEKVLMGEPWSFDRHLVVFQRYDLSTPMEALTFDKVAFWVQIHNLPYSLLTSEVAMRLGESLGEVNMPKDLTEMRGGTFMRVRVNIDISEPLCRGRCVAFDAENEGWVAFQYERLPNLCYWCGHLTHDDKECVLWLQSKGTLSVDDQQFGAWIRASQFNTAKKSIVNALCGLSPPPSSVASVISGAIALCGLFRQVEFSHIRRQGNTPAHLLAKHALGIVDYIAWMEETPCFLMQALTNDVTFSI
nr:uncharacterized protein LOC112040689 [Quercus suber]